MLGRPGTVIVKPGPIKRRRGNFQPIQILPPAPTNPRNIRMAQQVVRTTSRKRPIDKILVNVSQSTDATQVSTTLLTATFPCTVVGLRWDLTVLTDAGTGRGVYSWVIVIVRDGVTASQMSHTDGATIYAPEQDVMAFGKGVNQITGLTDGHQYNGSTKTMRKLMGGDKLQFLAKGEATDTQSFVGGIQFFCKS